MIKSGFCLSRTSLEEKEQELDIATETHLAFLAALTSL